MPFLVVLAPHQQDPHFDAARWYERTNAFRPNPSCTEQRWRARLRDVPVNLVIALDGEPAGMVSITAPDADGTVEMISMWVAPAARGRGVGDEPVR